MKRSIIGVALALSLFLAPLAHADSVPVPIGDPYTDTLQLWSEIASAISSLANDFATLFNGHEAASTNAPSNSQQGSASLAATVESFNSAPHTITSATSSSTTTSATSDQTTLSQDVKSAQSTAPAHSTILSGPTPAFNASNSVTQSELTQALLALSTSLSTKLAPTITSILPEWVAADGNPTVPYAAVSNIGQLSNVTITNANLSASEIPALNYFPSTSTISIGYGGTGTSNAPSYGQLLLGNGNGGYTLTATSSLGILSGSSLLPSANTWSALNLFAGGASTTNFSNTGTAYFGSTATSSFDAAGALSLVSNGLTVGTNQLVVSGGDVGIGTTSPSTTFAVNGNGYITGNWTAANFYGAISSTTVLATGGTTARAIGDIAADVVNVKSFGAKGNGVTDDSAAINAAISYIRNADDAGGAGNLNKYELYFPQGKYLIDSTINLTCYSDPNGTGLSTDDGCRPNGGGSEIGESHSFLPISAYGAQIVCNTSGTPCIDGLGSRFVQIAGLTVYGSCTFGSEPNWGIQIGRTEPSVGADDWYFHSVNFEGCYNKAAYYDLASEDTTIDGDSWFQNQDTNNTFATSTGPYSAVWDSGNHWQVTSAFVTEAITKDSPNSFNDNTVDGGSFYPSSPSSHSGGIWLYGTRRLTFINSYIVSQQGSCVNIYFDASSPSSLTGNTDHAPQEDNFQIHCEGVLSNIFLITGQQSHPLIMGLQYSDHAVGAGNGAGSVFALDPGVTALTLQNVDINIIGSGSAPKTLWDTPSAYTVSGTVTVPAAGGNTTWVAPGTWTGCVYIGTSSPSCGGLTNTGMLNITSSTGGTIAFDNDPILYASSTLSDVFLGFSAGAATTTTGTDDTAIGWQALSVNTSGIRDTAIGYQALQSNAGTDNAALGNGAARLVTNSGDITAIGSGAMVSHTGANDTAIGAYSLEASGNGNNDTALGYEAGFADTSGAQNIFLGFHAASTTASGSDNIALCYACDLPSVNGGNQLDIGNLVFGTGINGTLSTVSTGNIGIGTTTPSARLSVWGSDAASSTVAFNVANSASTTVFSVFDGGNAELSGSLSQSSDQRLKTNIQSLDASSSLSFIDELNPVTFNWIDPNQTTALQLGFIAQQVQQIFPNLVSTTSATALTPDGTLSLNYIGLISPIVSAIQALDQELSNLAATVAGFAQAFTTHILTGDDVTANNELCVGSTCVTPAQFQAMVAAASAPQSSGQGSGQAPLDDAEATNTPPVIQINGDNPAIIQVGATYNDLGAIITGPTADLNLGITTYVNDAAMNPVQIDTSAAATDTIDYVAIDQNGLTSTSTRTVIIEAPSIAPSDDASSTDATTTATSTAQ